MRYLVTGQSQLFQSKEYEVISVEESLKLLGSIDILGLDTETKLLDVYLGELLLVQIGNKDIQVAIDITTTNIKLYKNLLEDKKKLFILHNAKFDLRWFYKEGIVIQNVFDTFIAEKIIWLGFPPGIVSLSLQACCKRYFNIELDKSVRGEIYKGLTERVVIYGCNDVIHLEDLMNAQMKTLTERHQINAIKLENEFVKVLAYIEFCGIKLDRSKWKAKMITDKERLDKCINELNEWVLNYGDSRFIYTDKQGDLFSGWAKPTCSIKWSSSQQVIPLLETLGFNLLAKDKKTGKMRKTTDSKLIKIQEDVSDIAPIYLDYCGAYKTVTSFGQNFLDAINPKTGRIHPTYTQLMDTGRISCGSGGKKGSKGKADEDDVEDESEVISDNEENRSVNIQQIPADDETRAAFVPEEGYLLIDSDYGDQEGHTFTELTQDKKWIEFYNDPNPRDGHSFVAKMCFPEETKGMSEMEVKEQRHDLRKYAKACKFCFNYNGSAETAAKSINIPVELARNIYKNYFTMFNGISNYFKKSKKAMWDRGYILISSFTGLRAYIYDWPTLKKIEKRINSDSSFWDRYRYSKSSGEIIDLPKPVLHEIYQKFAEGVPVEEMTGLHKYKSRNSKKQIILKSVSVNAETIYVSVAKYLFKRKSSSENQSCNYPSQGMAAANSKLAGVKYFNHLIESGRIFTIKIPNFVHDEYLIEVPKELAEEEAGILKKCMEDAADVFCKVCKISAEPEIAPYWKH